MTANFDHCLRRVSDSASQMRGLLQQALEEAHPTDVPALNELLEMAREMSAQVELLRAEDPSDSAPTAEGAVPPAIPAPSDLQDPRRDTCSAAGIEPEPPAPLGNCVRCGEAVWPDQSHRAIGGEVTHEYCEGVD